ncbi:MAG TPA: sulfite exporter TauE/SafE family protein [Candidatus Nitrosotenuis sp.]|nr:sulfite exporter TauE/SafE family protein [Candidatus Nitrosotenuis sp.]
MPWLFYPALVAAGFLCGFINTLAGSGSLVTLPLLIFMGLPANLANGTNRVGIVLQNLTATWAFSQRQLLDASALWTLAVPSVLGAVAGARVAVDLDEASMRLAIGALMLAMLAVLLVRPEHWLEGHPQGKLLPPWVRAPIFFLIGMYGGFIQAGVGIFLTAGLVLAAGYDLVRANALKVALNMIFTFPALLVFWYHGQVAWLPGLALAVGNVLGAWAAVGMATRRGAPFLRRALIAVVVFSAADFLGLFDRLKALLAP